MSYCEGCARRDDELARRGTRYVFGPADATITIYVPEDHYARWLAYRVEMETLKARHEAAEQEVRKLRAREVDTLKAAAEVHDEAQLEIELLKGPGVPSDRDVNYWQQRAETAEAQVRALWKEAQRIMWEKGSYDVAIDPRVLREYERAYRFIKQLADPTPESLYCPGREDLTGWPQRGRRRSEDEGARGAS